ncbi:MAG TPA: GNAT family protein [Myxococcaceae bacterium]|nr:GNAT family protein [Myxococcaceae bacterium]
MQPRATIPKLADLDVVLTTPRLRLRPLRDDDVDDLWPYVSDRQFPRMMSWVAHTDKEQTRAFIKTTHDGLAANTHCTWAIEYLGKVWGTIGLDDITWQMRAWRIDRAEMGYWLAPPMWKQGLMTEAALAVLRFAFETLGLHKISIGCLAENAPSRRVIEKCGFRYVGQYEDDVWRDGAWHSHLRFEMLTSEWSQLRTATLRFPGTG